MQALSSRILHSTPLHHATFTLPQFILQLPRVDLLHERANLIQSIARAEPAHVAHLRDELTSASETFVPGTLDCLKGYKYASIRASCRFRRQTVAN